MATVSKRSLATVAIVSIFAAGSLATVIGVVVPQEQGVQTLVMLAVSWFAAAGLLLASPRPRPRFGGFAGTVLLTFIGVTLFSCLLSQLSGKRQDASDMWRFAVQALAPTLLFWCCHAWASVRFRVEPVDAAVVTIACVCICSVVLEATGLVPYETYGRRHFGFMGDTVAWELSFSATYLLVRGKYWVAGLCAIALLLTQSRGASIVFLAAVLLFLVASPARKSGKGYYVKIGVVILLLSVTYFSADTLTFLLDRFSDTAVMDNDRLRTNTFTWSVFTADPVFGLGYGAHTYVYTSTIFTNVAGQELWGTPTSTWYQVLADSGLVGFLPFAIFLLAVIRVGLRTIRRGPGGPEQMGLMGLSLWLIPYLLLNHSAAWLLPGSRLSLIVFAASGIVVGSKAWRRRQRQRPAQQVDGN